MQAICYMGGAGLKTNTRLAGIRQIDIAPTLAHLLGIPVPKEAQGHILGEALQGY
jgi:arylsulfatase A-like enzyme